MHSMRPSSVQPAHARFYPTEPGRSASVPPEAVNTTAPQYVFSSQFVSRAFEDFDRGSPSGIQTVIKVLEDTYSHDNIFIDIDTLNYLSSLIELLNQSFIYRLSSKHSLLVKALLHTNWSRFELKNGPKTLVNGAYTIFLSRMSDWILNVLSAFLFHLNPVLEALVIALSNLSTVVVVNSQKNRNRKEMLSLRVHGIIKPLIKLIPSLQSSFLPFIHDFFPHPRNVESHDSLSGYLSECLKICTYWPDIRPAMVELLVSKIVQIDVEVQIEIDELEDEVLEHLENNVLDDIDGDDKDSVYPNETQEYNDDDNEDESCPLVSNTYDNIATIKMLICRLDSCLLLFFEFIEKVKREESEVSFANLYISLLIIFEKAILPTMRSRYTQFLLFFATSLDERFPDYFLGVLISRLSSSSFSSASSSLIAAFKGSGGAYYSGSSSTWIDTIKIPSYGNLLCSEQAESGAFDALKLTAVCYIGGYVARAKFIPTKTVRRCLFYLFSWAERYIKSHGCSDCLQGLTCRENNGSSCKAQFAYKHSTFFAICQAIFYILCFRHKECFSNDIVDEDIPSHVIKQSLVNLLANGCLSPLASTTPIISSEFVNIIETFYPEFNKINGVDLKAILTPANSRPSTPTYPPAAYTLSSNMLATEDVLTISAQLKSLESLETFFPFDPFRLPRSKVFIPESIFIDWSGCDSLDNEM